MIPLIKKLAQGAEPFSRLLGARILGQRIPFILYFLVTERCNLKCSYCWIRRSSEVYEQEMSTAKVLQVIDDFHKLGTRYVSILGGEPLLRTDLAEILTHIRGRGMMNDVITNGLLIHKQLEALKQCHIVCISLEGPPETHERDRGAGTYDRIMQNVELLRANNVRFRFNATITRNTIHTFKHIAELAKKYNAGIAVGVAIMNTGKEHDAVPDVAELREFWKEVRAFKQAGYPIEKSLYAIDSLIANPHLLLECGVREAVPKGKGIVPCNFGRYLCYLGSDGTLYPCCHPDLYGKIDFDSNVLKIGAQQAWRNVVAKTRCRYCSMMVGCDINNFLNLDPPAIWEAFYTYAAHMKS